MISNARVWKFGDGVDTDVLAPGLYFKLPAEEAVKHCLESVRPEFAGEVREGDVFVAGDSLGIGSSREQAPANLKALGIRVVLAKSFARIFYRNALNIGLPALACADTDRIDEGDRLTIDPVAGTVVNETKGETYSCDPIPEHLMDMIADGGLMPHLKKKFAEGKTA
jgi:3-isopropylmalate/(R)-2-methylmalate dehydratase small subunit